MGLIFISSIYSSDMNSLLFRPLMTQERSSTCINLALCSLYASLLSPLGTDNEQSSRGDRSNVTLHEGYSFSLCFLVGTIPLHNCPEYVLVATLQQSISAATTTLITHWFDETSKFRSSNIYDSSTRTILCSDSKRGCTLGALFVSALPLTNRNLS